jgi:hypothetical protein
LRFTLFNPNWGYYIEDGIARAVAACAAIALGSGKKAFNSTILAKSSRNWFENSPIGGALKKSTYAEM